MSPLDRASDLDSSTPRKYHSHVPGNKLRPREVLFRHGETCGRVIEPVTIKGATIALRLPGVDKIHCPASGQFSSG